MYLKCTTIRERAVLPLGIDWLNDPLNGGLMQGGAYLVAGEPGGNKTTLVVQVAMDLAMQGRKVLIALNEQTPSELRAIFSRVGGGEVPDAVIENVIVERFDEPAELLQRLRRRLPNQYPDVSLVIVDSLQGSGLASTANRAYRVFFDFVDEAKSRDLTTLTVCHVTKAGKLAGPKSLEHKMDVCLHLRKAMSLRHLFVPKNRFGPELMEPVMLMSTQSGLVLSPHRLTECASILGYAGEGADLFEVQASVSLPKLGGRAELNAPFLPLKRVRQIIATLCKVPGVDLNDLCYAINALIPDGQSYSAAMELPLAMAVLTAYLQRPVPAGSLFIGGVDLRRNIRPPETHLLSSLCELLADDAEPRIEQVCVSSAVAGLLADRLAATGGSAAGVHVTGARTLDELLGLIWPDVFTN